MKIKENFILRKIAGDDVVVPIGENIADFNGAITLNETAALLWKELETGSTREELKASLCKEYDVPEEKAYREELKASLCKEYDVPEEKAYKDIDKFVNILQEHGILEEE